MTKEIKIGKLILSVLLSKEKDVSDKTIEYIYNGEDQKIEELESGVHLTYFQYNQDGYVIITSDKFGNVELNDYDRHNLVSSTDKFETLLNMYMTNLVTKMK